MVLLMNHSTWWDGFFVYLLNKQSFQWTVYQTMLEEQLSKYKLFAKTGAYPIKLKHRQGIVESLEHTNRLLNKGVPLISIFPQGQLLPYIKG